MIYPKKGIYPQKGILQYLVIHWIIGLDISQWLYILANMRGGGSPQVHVMVGSSKNQILNIEVIWNVKLTGFL